jgi:hypothetical protein
VGVGAAAARIEKLSKTEIGRIIDTPVDLNKGVRQLVVGYKDV